MSSVQDVRKSQKEWTAVKKNVGVGEEQEMLKLTMLSSNF